jgi:hypothetical protein
MDKSSRPCSYFAKGCCNKGDNCSFFHSVIQKKTVCTYYLENRCTYDTECRNYHPVKRIANDGFEERIDALSPDEKKKFILLFESKEYHLCGGNNGNCDRKATTKHVRCCISCGTGQGHTPECYLMNDMMKYA